MQAPHLDTKSLFKKLHDIFETVNLDVSSLSV